MDYYYSNKKRVGCLLLYFFIIPHFSHSSSLRFSSAFTSNNIIITNNQETESSILKLTTRRNSGATTFDPTRVTRLSWTPRAFYYSSFLTYDECNHLINLAKGGMEKSMVVDDETGKSVESEIRTSSGMFLDKAQDKLVAGIEARIAAWTFLPQDNGEQIQILHYELGQKYEPHYDYFVDQVNTKFGGNRVATVLMYLSNIEKGGETVFPYSEAKDIQQKDDDWSDCAKTGYAVKPKKGDALLFYSLHPNATIDLSSYHGSCPVIEGEKWSATKWIHVRSFEERVEEATGDNCVDEDENCPVWAQDGECEINPLYMVGTKDEAGTCRKSCNACS